MTLCPHRHQPENERSDAHRHCWIDVLDWLAGDRERGHVVAERYVREAE